MHADTFPRQQARTRRFSLGVARTFSVSPDGSRVVFLRSAACDDPLTALWAMDVATGEERVAADPRDLETGGPFPDSPAEEMARRQRSREMADGIVAYSTDRNLRRGAFALAGELWVADLDAGGCRRWAATGPVFDPRMDPSGAAVAYCSGRHVRVVDAAGADSVLAGEEREEVTWGQAEFVAAEEMGRSRGHWWAPDGRSLLATRVDVSAVATWWIADPAHPDRAPVAHRYPAAGTADAHVTLHHVDLAGASNEISWDRGALPYLVAVTWTPCGPPLVVVESRDHTRSQVLSVDVATGATTTLAEHRDDAWVDRPPGLPAWLADGRLVWAGDTDDTTRLTVGGEAVTPPGLQVRDVGSVGEDVVFTASPDPTTIQLWRWSDAGLERLAPTGGAGMATGVAGGPTVVVVEHWLDAASRSTVRDRPVAFGTGGRRQDHEVVSHAADPLVTPSVRILEVGPERLRVGVLMPTGHRPGRSVPVVMSPYGGPGVARVVRARSAWLESQWLADQGFAVVVADGRGTPGRGPAWERAIHGDLATAVLADQVDALHGAAAEVADLDTTRVGIRGWSFGGYLAALAVLRRPDVFSVAVAGAPVTDWRLYDTYYTERYLGHPEAAPGAYERTSLLGDAAKLERPLMIIHGLVDDNVVVAHSLRLSQRLIEAGRPHCVLPLSGVTHMASQEDVAEHLLGLQAEFLARHLGVPASRRG
ncbi:MAG TPA: prolyl oligopeptidase family serine peptidase [Acidimicrobiales bacterium]|nr:prolyl oligopeptidase family serine peptidase [Acidimicrobiales bacterium]